MRGLLSGSYSDDPDKNASINQGLLAMGLGLLNAKGNFGQALGQAGLLGMQTQQDAYTTGLSNNARKAQMEQMRLQAQKAAELEAQRKRDEELMRAQFAPVSGGQAMTNGAGPTMGNAGNLGAMPQFDPRAMLGQGASMEGVSNAMQFNAALNPGPKLRDVAPGATVFDERTGKPVFQNPKADDLPTAIREYQFAQGQGYKGSFEQWDMARKRAGATNVNVPVNLGQKGFDNTLKLRGDFRSEPIYKAHQEVQSAYSQIQQSLKQGTPAGDLAGATKIMKLLDPGSVVRESELGMAMAATGLADRVQNYGNMILTGQKLTPTQRKEFQQLADALASESAKQYNAKRSEYKGIVDRNGLSEPDVLGTESTFQPPATPTGVRRYNPATGMIE